MGIAGQADKIPIGFLRLVELYSSSERWPCPCSLNRYRERTKVKMNTYSLVVLGAFRITQEDSQEEIYITSQNARWLLALLALEHPRGLSRTYVAGLFWPDMPEPRARRALSQAIWRLRQVLTQDAIITQGDSILLGDIIHADLIRFRQHLDAGTVTELKKAVALYGGDFLPECYEDWALLARERLRERYLTALFTLFEKLRKERRYEEALSYIKEFVRHAPLREDAYRALMEVCLILDRPQEALQHFNVLRTRLLEELGVEPSPELRVLQETAQERLQMSARAGPAPIFVPNAHIPFVGRHKERRLLLERVEQAMQGQGGVVALEAQPGMGKTRLLSEVRAGAEWRGMLVGYAQAEEISQPYALLKEAVADLLTPSCVSGLRTSVAAPLLETAAYLWPMLGNPPEETHPRQLQQAVVRVLAGLARCTPIALLLDDIHNSDEAILDILEALGPELSSLPMLIVIAYRPLEAQARPRFWERLLALDRDISFQRLALQPLTDQEQRAFIRAALSIPREAPILDRLSALCGHVPLHIAEVLRYLRRRGTLSRDAEGEWQLEEGDTPLPPTVAGLVQRRVQLLQPEARDVLELMAVIGERISLPVLDTVLTPRYRQLPSLLHELSRHGFIVQEEHAYRFSHALVRDAIHANLPPERRRALHRGLAALWRQQKPVPWAQVAHHARAGDQVTLAVYAYLKAAEEAMRTHAHEQALRYCEAALELGPARDVTTCDLWRLTGEALMVLGQKEAARKAFARSIYLARCLNNPYRLGLACLKAGALDIRLGRHRQARRFLHRALAVFEQAEDHMKIAETYTFLADIEETVGNLPQALEYVQRADEHIGDNTRSLQYMHILSRWAVITARMGDYEEARRRYEAAVELARETGNLYVEGFSLNGLGLLALTTREHARARDIFNQVMDVAQRLGDQHNYAVTRLNMAVAAGNSGHFHESVLLGEEALEEARKVNSRTSITLALFLLSENHAVWGDFDRARAYREEAERVAESIEFASAVGYAWRHRSVWHRYRGELQEAIACGQEGLSYFEKLGMREKIPMVAYHLAQAYLGNSQPQEAIDVLRLGLQYVFAERQRAILQATLALALARVGRIEEAQHLLQTILPIVRPMSEDEYLPQLWYDIAQTAEAVMPDQATEALRMAYVHLRSQSLHVPEEWQASFMHDVLPHRMIAQAWLHLTPRPVERLRLLLPAADGSGQVRVTWTVDAGDEDAIVEATRGPLGLRRHRLARLLNEARQQGARPSHGDLADALGVSVPTIRRDLRALQDASPSTSPAHSAAPSWTNDRGRTQVDT